MAQRQLTFASYRVSRTSPSVKRLTKKTGEIYSKKWRTRLEKCTRKRRRRGRAGEQRHIASVKEDREYNRFADNLKNSMRTCKPFDLSASIFASDMRRPLQAADSTLNIVQPQSKDSETSTQKENSIAGGDQDELLNGGFSHSKHSRNPFISKLWNYWYRYPRNRIRASSDWCHCDENYYYTATPAMIVWLITQNCGNVVIVPEFRNITSLHNDMEDVCLCIEEM